MFGSLRLISPELVREHSISARGKHCIYLRVRCTCTECGEETSPLWDNVRKGLTTRCVKCAHRASRRKVVQNVWGRVPDEIDQWLRCKWFSIRGRCDDPTNRQYGNYGGRGVKLSEEFHNPIAFIDYMRSVGDIQEAYKFSMEVDRIDNDKGYERGNLRWATRRTQMNNTRNTLYVTFNNEKMCFGDFVKNHTTLSRSRAYALYREGFTLYEIAAVKGRGPRGPRNPGV